MSNSPGLPPGDGMPQGREICQRCGGDTAATGDSRCLCETPTLYRLDPDPPSDEQLRAWVREEWDSMYPDVIKDLAVGAARIPDEKITPVIFDRLVELEIETRQGFVESIPEYHDFNRTWAAILQTFDVHPEQHLEAMMRVLPWVREEIRKQGGQFYLAGEDALSRREDAMSRESLRVDENYDPLPDA